MIKRKIKKGFQVKRLIFQINLKTELQINSINVLYI